MNQHFSYIKHWTGVLFSAIPFFYLSWTLLRVWHDPMSVDNGTWVPYGVGLLLIEFLLLHSSAFLGGIIASETTKEKRLQAIFGFFMLYGLMAWGMAMSIDPSIMWVFIGVTIGRVATVFTLSDEGKQVMQKRAAFGTLWYILVVFATVFIPVPEWGITSSVVNEVYPNRGSGLWETNPERAIAGAAVYFFILGLLEIFVFGLKGTKKPEEKA